MTTATMTIRLDEYLKERLEELAAAIHRNKSFVVIEAVKEYLKAQEWQISEIKKGIAEADADQLIDHADIISYWKKKRADSMD